MKHISHTIGLYALAMIVSLAYWVLYLPVMAVSFFFLLGVMIAAILFRDVDPTDYEFPSDKLSSLYWGTMSEIERSL